MTYHLRYSLYSLDTQNFRDPLGYHHKSGEDTYGTYMYHHAKFHANQLHRHRDICSRTIKNNYSRFWYPTNCIKNTAVSYECSVNAAFKICQHNNWIFHTTTIKLLSMVHILCQCYYADKRKESEQWFTRWSARGEICLHCLGRSLNYRIITSSIMSLNSLPSTHIFKNTHIC